MNKVIISGNLCQDVELKQSTGGKSVVTNAVAVQRDYRNSKGEYESDFINIVVWDKQAEYLHRYAHKGDRVEIVGRWTVRKYQANDGSNRIVNECTVESIKAFNRQPKQEQPTFEELQPDQDFPF